MRLAFTIDELRAIALGRSARSSTISTTKACRAGVSKALTTPWKALRRRIQVTSIVRVRARPASANDCSIERTWVTQRTRYRPQRSTQTPARGASRNVGIWPAKPTRPSTDADPVRRYTSQLVATRVIQVPTSDVPCPRKKSR